MPGLVKTYQSISKLTCEQARPASSAPRRACSQAIKDKLDKRNTDKLPGPFYLSLHSTLSPRVSFNIKSDVWHFCLGCGTSYFHKIHLFLHFIHQWIPGQHDICLFNHDCWNVAFIFRMEITLIIKWDVHLLCYC